jgi:hypothetical protein
MPKIFNPFGGKVVFRRHGEAGSRHHCCRNPSHVLHKSNCRSSCAGVIPPSLSGLRVELEMAGHSFEAMYRVGSAGCGPSKVELNGAEICFTRGENLYRTGAAEVPMATSAKGSL